MSVENEERIFDKLAAYSIPEPNSGCIIWLGSVTRGYGRVWFDRRMHNAHRLAWEAVHGPVPAGMNLDHLCRNRSCINLRHLEAVTIRENTLRGIGPTARNYRKATCRNGHPYDYKMRGTDRDCRRCRREVAARYRATHREHIRWLNRESAKRRKEGRASV